LGWIIPNTLPTRARSIRLDILDDVVRFFGSWRGVSDSEIDFLFWYSWVWILFRLLDRFRISNFLPTMALGWREISKWFFWTRENLE
jgi:hypothetical protein